MIDVGGTKYVKSGYFSLDRYGDQVLDITYLNVNKETSPDILASAASMPLPNDEFDVVICSETIEHIEDPSTAISEIFRILKPGGAIVMTIPFMFHVHSAPYDYQRWTESKIRREFQSLNIEVQLTVEPLNNLVVLITDLLVLSTNSIKNKYLRILFAVLFLPIKILLLDIIPVLFKKKLFGSFFMKSYTTHFGILARK